MIMFQKCITSDHVFLENFLPRRRFHEHGSEMCLLHPFLPPPLPCPGVHHYAFEDDAGLSQLEPSLDGQRIALYRSMVGFG